MPGLRRGPEIEALNEPASVVSFFELPQRKLQLVYVFEMADPEQLLFQSPEETFNATIPLRLSNEGRRGFDAEKSYFLLKVITHVLAAVIMPEPQTGGHCGTEAAEVIANSLTNRFQSFKPGSPLHRVDAHAIGGAVINGGKDRHLAVRHRQRGRCVGTPDLVERFGDNRALVRIAVVHRGTTSRRQQFCRTHQTQDTMFRRTNAGIPQPRPDLPMSLSEEGTGLNHRPNLLGQLHIREGRLWTALLNHHSRCGTQAPRIESRARKLPHPRNPRHTVRLIRGNRSGAAHGFDFHGAKGRFCSIWRIFAFSNSLSIARSAATDFIRCLSSSEASVSRLFRPASPLARKRSRQLEIVAAVTPFRRLSVSRSSPRRTSRTTETFRLADHRPRPTSADDSTSESRFFSIDIVSPVSKTLSRKIVGRRKFVLCGVPMRRLPPDQLIYERRNGNFVLQITGHPEYGVPFGQDRIVPIFLATLAVKHKSPVVRFESAAEMLATFGLHNGGKEYRRLVDAFERIFGATIFFGTDRQTGKARVIQRSRFNFFREAQLWYQRGGGSSRSQGTSKT